MFGLYKFVTMLKNSPNVGTGEVTLKDDPRILPVGRFLRKTKINELPQLINIFLGDMSIIGPRPQTQRCFDAFPIRYQQTIVKGRPGLSGIGSIVFRAEEDMINAARDPNHFYDNVIMPYKGALENWYAWNHTILSYFLLIGLTVWVVVFPHSTAVWRVFRDLPEPPDELKTSVNYLYKTTVHSRAVIRQVASLHRTAMNRGFMSTLGLRFLELLYVAIDESQESILIVEMDGDHVCGFVAGGCGVKSVYKELVSRPLWLLWALAPCVLHLSKLWRIFEILRQGKNRATDATTFCLPRHELFSIAVAPQYRGKGIGETLYHKLCMHFCSRGIIAFRILVGKELKAANRFYQRMGAKAETEITLHKGSLSSIYMQYLSADLLEKR